MYNFLIKAKEGNVTFIVSISADTYADMETKFNTMKGNRQITIDKVMNVQEIVQIPQEEEEIPQEEQIPQEEEQGTE